MGGSRQQGFWADARICAALLLLVAVGVRGLIPAGWMPGRLAGGAPIVICTGGGAEVIPAKAPPGHGHAPARHTYEKAGFTPLSLVRYYKELPAVHKD